MALNNPPPDDLEGWLPARLGAETDGTVWADWCRLTTGALREPFFAETIDLCLRHPFNQLFLRRTPIARLGERFTERPGLTPAGFIFHMSRCGSTLVSRLLAGLPGSLVLSEPDPMHWILRGGSAPSRAVAGEWLRWALAALAQPWSGQETRVFVKFDPWSMVDLPLIREAFPDVPWVFLYRAPLEVLVSNLRRRGTHTVPGVYGAALLGMDQARVRHMPPEEYCGRMLQAICDAAIRHHNLGRVLLVNFGELPGAVWDHILGFFGVACTEATRDELRRLSRFDAKRPAVSYIDDVAEKNRTATPLARQMAETLMMPSYRRLEALRASRADSWRTAELRTRGYHFPMLT